MTVVDTDAPLPPVVRTRTFARGLWRIAAADVSCGNHVALLRDGDATFAAKLALIAEARETIEFEGYIFRHDEVGERFREALIDAARRGVKVRLLVDWIGRMGTPYSFFRPMRDAGVEVRIFNPPGFRRWLGLLPRDHRKLLVVDGWCGVTGGIGIGKEWKAGMLRSKRAPWRDTAVRLAGPAAADMLESFNHMWVRAEGRQPRGLRLLRRGRASYLDPQLDPPSLVGIIEGEPGRLRVERALQMQALGAEKTIWIASAYFAPSWGVVEALAGAARDGVDVRVLVPSRYDHPWLRTFITPFYQRLLKNGVRIWEWRGDMMHAKTNVVDGRWTRVGSTDFNLLGVAINFELDAVIEDAKVGAQAEAMFLEDLDRSREILWRGGKPLPAPERAAPPPPPMPPERVLPLAERPVATVQPSGGERAEGHDASRGGDEGAR